MNTYLKFFHCAFFVFLVLIICEMSVNGASGFAGANSIIFVLTVANIYSWNRSVNWISKAKQTITNIVKL